MCVTKTLRAGPGLTPSNIFLSSSLDHAKFGFSVSRQVRLTLQKHNSPHGLACQIWSLSPYGRSTAGQGVLKNSGDAGAQPPFAEERGWPPKHAPSHALPCQIWLFYVKWYECMKRDVPETMGSSHLTFKVTWSHQNRHGSIGYLWLPIIIIIIIKFL